MVLSVSTRYLRLMTNDAVSCPGPGTTLAVPRKVTVVLLKGFSGQQTRGRSHIHGNLPEVWDLREVGASQRVGRASRAIRPRARAFDDGARCAPYGYYCLP